MKIAVDGMGGDHPSSYAEVVKASVEAARDLRIEILLVGNRVVLEYELEKHPSSRGVTIVDAPDIIGMKEKDLAEAVRRRDKASMVVGMKLVKTREASAFVTAGNSGAVLASASVHLKRIPGIERAAFGSVMPYNQGKLFLMDIGANNENRPKQVAQFGLMGSIYVREILGLSNPRVGLLGSLMENYFDDTPSPHEQERQQTAEMIREMGLNFVGFVSPEQAHRDLVDVMVIDGFTGNTALKVGEGTMDYLRSELKALIKSNLLFLLAGLTVKRALKRHFGGGDSFSAVGGAYLLGVQGNIVKAHGRSDAQALKNAIRVGYTAGIKDLEGTITAAVRRPERARALAV